MAAPVEVLLWGGGAFGIWLLTLSSVSLEEIAVGGFSSVLCGCVARATRRALKARWSLRWRGVAPALWLLASIVVDCIQLLTLPLRPHRRAGRFEQVETAAKGSCPHATAIRALAGIVISASPGTVVVEADPESGRLTVHSLRFRDPHLEERFASSGRGRSARR